ncbi:dolichyl pyrophosphate Man9GlcNAc2 alpha-1,3-glucosyltransferase-like isoform X2 [Montipora foliosa]|uniref:dolichyl pyrophosphate Man9GlcNAc2 alpha-1,3-glucosyltransferase-like isoform X2 n=1 Tax=Montipora foliosa TaxID=591990 RepID=UPI0035F1623C
MSQNFYSVALAFLAAIVVRWCVSLSSYSGKGKAPMFGDYEAQRHWMEITYNLPIDEWYTNTSNNDLMYWGLDYPPLTAYHSWVCGFIANKINPKWVALHKSRGHESPQHKLFMRYTVLVADLVIYIPAVFVFSLYCSGRKPVLNKVLTAVAILFYPGLILIDYGHFQYNTISLGLALWAVIGLVRGRDLLGSVAFTLALNYKQMELYHAFPFFFYLLGKSLQQNSWVSKIFSIVKLGIVVLVTFVLCWLPFLTGLPMILQVLHRLFPFARGIFEDKVANIWCSISVLIKVKSVLSQTQIIKVSTWSTLTACLPSSLNLFKNPSAERFVIALVNSSMAFFIFSYQVHEKSILLAALPVCLLLHHIPFECTWFLIISTFSMWPLLLRDGLALPYISCLLLFYAVSYHVFELQKTKHLKQILFLLSMLGCLCLHIGFAVVRPPSRYPDLWPVLISLYSFAHFLGFFCYFNYLQFTLPYTLRPVVTKHKKS